jgi:hypothetical protein
MARDGADEAAIAECVVNGVERDIRWDGGAPAFGAAVDLLLVATSAGASAQQLLRGVETICRTFADLPLTRYVASAAERIGLSARAAGYSLSRQAAVKALIVELGVIRCCNSLVGSIARGRAIDLAASQNVVQSIRAMLGQTSALVDLAPRMEKCSSKGLPAKATKGPQISHTAESLNEEEL